MRKQSFKKLQLADLHFRVTDYLANLTADQLRREERLKYDPTLLLRQTRDLLNVSIRYIMVLKYPLLTKGSSRVQSVELDKQMKSKYQDLINKHILSGEFEFEHFILIAVKTMKRFLEGEFIGLEIGKEEEKEAYCIIIKILLGLHVHDKAYLILEAKFVDSEKYIPCPTIIDPSNPLPEKLNKAEKGSKKIITLNHIQAKLQKRRLNRLRNGQRSSLNTWRNSQEIQQFKQNLMKELKVIDDAQADLKRIKYSMLEGRTLPNEPKKHQNKYLINNRSVLKKIINTEQISASLELALLLNESNHSYTKRNIAVRLTDSTPRLSNPVYEVSRGQERRSRREQGMIVEKGGAGVSKKTKTYWARMASKMREINSSFQY